MIEAIEITNFQSHEYSILDFHAGVNVIKGTSHHGKSAIIRAFKWALFNKPKGEGFKSHFANDQDSVEVGLSFSDGAWVSRVRDNENKYLSEHFTLKALKTDLPDEVTKITQIGEINFQSQDDDYFLIQGSPGQAGKKLNEIIGLQIIDESKATLNKKINKLNVELSIVEGDLEAAIEKLKNFAHLDKAEKLVDQIDTLQAKNVEVWRKQSSIFQTVEHIKTNRKLLVDLTKWLKVEKDHKKLKEQLNNLFKLQTRSDKLQNIINPLEVYLDACEEHKKVLSLEPRFKIVQELQRKFKYASEKHLKIQKAYSGIHKLRSIVLRMQEELICASERRTELESQLEYCQYCGSERKYWKT